MGNKRRNATVRVSKEYSAKLIELSAQEFEQLKDASEQFKTHVHRAGKRKKELENIYKPRLQA